MTDKPVKPINLEERGHHESKKAQSHLFIAYRLYGSANRTWTSLPYGEKQRLFR